MFVLKKLVSSFFFPISLVLELSCVGLFLIWFTKRQHLGKVILTGAVLTLCLLSTGIVSNLLLSPLERIYEPFEGAADDVAFVVVLGGGHVSDPRLPPMSQIAPPALVRLVEGIRIYRRQPGAKLLVSGGAASDPVPHAHVMRDIALELGVPAHDIVLEDQSRDTRHEAQLIKPMVGTDPFVLVTSASHMPRSMGMFRAVGLDPIAAPVGHRVKRNQKLRPGMVFPGVDHLRKSSVAFYEYMGLTWAKLRNYL